MIEHLLINDVAPCVHYDSDGVQAAFIFPFAVFKAADLEVWVDKSRVTAGFTVSGAGISSGGVVLFSVPPAAGSRITLRRRMALERVSDFQTDGIIRAKTLNDELDYQVAAVQQVADDVSRCVQRPFTSGSTANLCLPDPVGGRAVKWAPDGLSLVNSDSDPDNVVAAVQAAAASAVDSAISAARSAVDAAAGNNVTQAAKDAAERARDQAQAAVSGVRVTVADTTAGPLAAKIVPGSGLVGSIAFPGGNEALRLDLSGRANTAVALALYNTAR